MLEQAREYKWDETVKWTRKEYFVKTRKFSFQV